MNELDKIAVLIDADNAQLSKMEAILDEVSLYGRVIVKKAFGDWKDAKLKNWEDVMKSLAIKPEQQFAYTKGKNATDIVLTISALDLLYTNIYDTFVLVSSDSDYTPLAIRLRESGVTVLGVGEKKTSDSFKNSCDEFIFTENFHDVEKGQKIPLNEKSTIESFQPEDIEKVHKLFLKAYEKYQENDGYVNVSAAGTYIKRTKPDFTPMTYGFKKIPELLQNYPDKYEVKKYKGKGTVTIIAYRCIL